MIDDMGCSSFNERARLLVCRAQIRGVDGDMPGALDGSGVASNGGTHVIQDSVLVSILLRCSNTAIPNICIVGDQQSCRHAVSQVIEIPEILECSRVTGSDSIIVKVVATSLDHLAKVIDQLSLYGIPTTSIIRSGLMKRHVIPRQILERGERGEE